MNSTAIDLAQARFQAALTSGTSTVPVALSQLLNQLSVDSPVQIFDTERIGQSICDEFSFLRSMIASGTPPNSATSATWESALRWLLSALRNWDSSETNSLNKLRALLSTLTALDANHAGLSSVASQVFSSQLATGLPHIIEHTIISPGFNDLQSQELRQQIESLAGSRNLERLWYMMPRMNFFLTPDLQAAVVFIYQADPATLASVIERRNDVLFSLMICTVLGTQSIVLASRVNNLIFKFISVANCRQNCSSGPLQSLDNTLQVLLLQVARTSAADWAAWMRVLFKFPGNNSSLDTALASVLQQLSQEHWTAFFKAISLDYSHRAAAPVADILMPFANSVKIRQKTLMWEIAFQVWSDWSYGQHQSNSSMFAPAACALDFPVSMYYASLQSDECFAEESSLLEAIETVEQRWFNSATELVSARNRLKSRLRLVQHGIALANGTIQALLPLIEPDEDLYARTRYYYHDVNTI